MQGGPEGSNALSKEGVVMAMQVSRQRVVDLLHSLGYPQVADEALRDLPDVVDLKEAQDWAGRHGISRDELINLIGGSP
jgi:hypothetical protein